MKHWTSNYDDDPNIATGMITVIWITMIANQIIMQILLFNFLIAIVTDSYIKVMSEKFTNMYEHKSELNYEYFLMARFLYMKMLKINMSLDLILMVSPEDDTSA